MGATTEYQGDYPSPTPHYQDPLEAPTVDIPSADATADVESNNGEDEDDDSDTNDDGEDGA